MLHETETRQTAQAVLHEQRAWEIQLLTLAIGLVAALYFLTAVLVGISLLIVAIVN